MIERFFFTFDAMLCDNFPPWFEAELRHRGLTDEQYAKDVGVERHIITQIRIGFIDPPPAVLKDLGLHGEMRKDFVEERVVKEVDRLYYVPRGRNDKDS